MSNEEDEEGEDGADDSEEEDEETMGIRAKIKQFAAEIKALETAIEKKRSGFQGGNPIMLVCDLVHPSVMGAYRAETVRGDDFGYASRYPGEERRAASLGR